MRIRALDPIPPEITNLITAHANDMEEPLLLAVAFGEGASRWVILEVLEGFGGNSVQSPKDFFRVSFGSTPAVLLPQGIELHLVLTNPAEFQLASQHSTSFLRRVHNALRQGNAKIVYQRGVGKKLAKELL